MLWPWPLTYDLERLSTDYHCQWVCQIWEQSIQYFLSYHTHTIDMVGSGHQEADTRDMLSTDGRVHLFALYTTSLSSSCRCIWRYWTSKIPVRYILSCAYLKLSKFTRLSFMQYMGLCVFSFPFLFWWLRICMLYLIIIIKSEVWPICHCLGLGPFFKGKSIWKSYLQNVGHFFQA